MCSKTQLIIKQRILGRGKMKECYAIIWGPGIGLFSTILGDFIDMFEVVSGKRINLGDNYVDFIIKTYSKDGITDWRLDEKIRVIQKASNSTAIGIIRFNTEDAFDLAVYKKEIRDKYSKRLEHYKYDNLIHITENDYEAELVRDALVQAKGKTLDTHLLLWVQNGLSYKSSHVNIPYHYIHNLEVYDYISKNNTDLAIDNIDFECDDFDYNKFIKILLVCDYASVAFFISNDNIVNSIKYLTIIKEMFPLIKTMAYGDLPVLLPGFFKGRAFDYIVDKNCDQEIAISDFFKYVSFFITEKEMCGIIKIHGNDLVKLASKSIKINSDEWGYPETTIFEKNKRMVITVSRGCPYACPYCNAALYYGTCERRRPIEPLIAFIKKYQGYRFKFFAPNFTLDKKWVIDFCSTLLDEDIHIQWSCTTRGDLLDDMNLLELMAKSGCYKIAVGVEAMADSNLSAINKNIQVKTIMKGIENVNKAGIRYKALIMLGIPSQTVADIYATLQTLYALDIEVRATAYTPFYDMKESMTPAEIESFDKRTYYAGIEGLHYGNFIKLICDTANYKKYLGE